MAAPTRPGNAERGWNDPPMLLHTGGPPPGSAAPRRTLLNKRVAHPAVPIPVPVAANTPDDLASSPVPSVILLPPAATTSLPQFPAPIIVPTMSPIDDSPISTATNPITNQKVNTEVSDPDLVIPDFDNDEQLYHFTLSRLRKTCISCTQRAQPRVIDEINRKLEIFSTMWKDGKISYPVKSAMARLATGIHQRKCDLAHHMHLSLMMDYVSEVGPWMVGIKRLIQEARCVEAPLSPTDSTSTCHFTADAQTHETTDSTDTANTQPNVDTGDKLMGKVTDLSVGDSVRSNSPATIETTMIQ